MAERYDWVTTEMFDAQLTTMVGEMSAGQILGVPGVYEALSEHLNNDVLEAIDNAQTPQDRAERKAREIGTDHGKAAASWVFDGNTPRTTYERWRQGLNDGDWSIMDQLPSPDLSGEYADGYTPNQLAEECGADSPDQWLMDAYEDAFRDAAQTEVERMIAAQLD